MKNELKLLVVDVDGTMTDGGIYYDELGNESKKFCTKDAAGLFAAKQCGITTMVLTGRACAATARRMSELKIDHIFQDVKDKAKFLMTYMAEHNIDKSEVMYIGDDLNDLLPMQLAGYVACPKDACPEILQIADYVSDVCGGHGAVRDCVEHYLREKGEWQTAICKIYGVGT